MTAKEMFEELGYKYEENNTEIIYFNSFRSRFQYLIVFYKDIKTIEKFKYYNNVSVGINVKELQAINKQIEELGWLDKGK